jgi:hypothetical protein
MGSLLSSNIGSMLSQIVSPVNQQPTQPTGITSIPVTNQNPMVNMTGGRFNPVRDPRLNRVASRPMFRTSRYDSQISDLLSRLIPNSSISRPGIESMLPSTSTREVPVNIPTPPPSFSIQDYLNSSFSKRPTMGTQALVPITLPTGETYNLRSGGDASNFRDFLQSIGRNPQDIENIFKRNELAMARGGRVNYQNGGPTKTPPKYIPLNMESVAKEIFGTTNLDNLTYNEKQTIYDYIEANRNKKAYGGRIGYADGSPATGLAIKLNRPVQSGDPLGSYYDDGKGPLTPGFLNDSYGPVNSLTGLRSIAIDRTQPVERKMGLFAYPDENMTNVVQALPRPGQYSTQIQSPSQTQLIKEAIMSLPQTRSNPQMNAMRKYSQVRDPRMMRLMQMLKRQPAAMGGIMNLKMGGMPVEMDLRAKGGFVPIGKKERADDVPARLSKNEFVFTANAVRNAGNGDIRKGAKRMYNLMHQLEAKR